MRFLKFLTWKIPAIALLLTGILALVVSMFYAEWSDNKLKRLLVEALGPFGAAMAVIGLAVLCLSPTVGLIVDLPNLWVMVKKMFAPNRSPAVESTDPSPRSESTLSKGPKPAQGRLSAKDREVLRWLAGVRNSALGGLLTGPIFLIFYWIRDFGEAKLGNPIRPDISERYLATLCPDIPAVISPTPVKDYPALVSLIPEFLGFGLLVGLVIGVALPGWRRFLNTLPSGNPRLSWLKNPYTVAISFGLVWGTVLGAAANPVFFGQGDGRPFMRLSTAAFAAQIAISLYLAIELLYVWRNVGLEALKRIISLAVYALIFPWLFITLDHLGNLSTYAYCQFYLSWDSEANRVVPGIRPILVGALYGGFVGTLVMWVVGGYISASDAMPQKKRRKALASPAA